MQIQVNQIDKEKRELAAKVKATAKRIDHLERAFRLEEIKYLDADYEAQRKRDRAAYDAWIEEEKTAAKRRHTEEIAMKKQLMRIAKDVNEYRSTLLLQREEQFEQLRREMDKRLEQEKAQRRAEYRQKLQEEAAKKAREEEAKRRKEEEEQRMREGTVLQSFFSSLSCTDDVMQRRNGWLQNGTPRWSCAVPRQKSTVRDWTRWKPRSALVNKRLKHG